MSKSAANLSAIAEQMARTADQLDRLVLTHQVVSDADELRDRSGALLNFAINRIFALGRAAPELVAPYLRGHSHMTITDPVGYWTSWVAPWIVSNGGHRRPDISPEWLSPKSKPGDMTRASKRKWAALQKAGKQTDPGTAIRRVEENNPTRLERESVHIPTKVFPVPISEMDDNQQHTLLRKSCECWAEHCRVVVEICKRAAPAPEHAISGTCHSLDFRIVDWFGTKHAFTAQQAAIVKLLWADWENQTPDVGNETLLNNVGAETKRLPDVFKYHAAWGTMIVPGETKGTTRLRQPQ